MSESEEAKPVVTALLSEELKPTREFQGDRRIAQKLSVKARQRTYELSDDQTVLDLKKAIIADAEANAGHLTPEALRVTDTLRRTDQFNPKNVIYQDKHAVTVELTDEQTLAECKNASGEVSVSVELRPSRWNLFVERYNHYCETHRWPRYAMIAIVIVSSASVVLI